MAGKRIIIAGSCFLGERFHENIALYTDKGVIEKIASSQVPLPREAEITDLSEFILMPPFRDSHMHFLIDGRPAEMNECERFANAYLSNGILSIVDAGIKSAGGFSYKKVHKGYPEIISAGYAIYRAGTYGSFLGKGVSSISEIKNSINELADAGADFIKVINSGIVSTSKPFHVTEGGFTSDELRMIVSEAAKRNLNVACHANSDNAIKAAVKAGVSSIAHGYFIKEETLHLMSDKGVAFIPTIYALKRRMPLLNAKEAEYINGVVKDHMKAVKIASDLGVKLEVGTDSGSPGIEHGRSFLYELGLFRDSGLSMEDVLRAACPVEIKVGNKAHFLAIKEGFIIARKIEHVIVEGAYMSVSDLG